MEKKPRSTQKRNKERGYTLEVKINKIANAFGFESKRTPASRGSFLGLPDQIDNVLTLTQNLRDFLIQSKKRKKISEFIKPKSYHEKCDMVVIEGEREKPHVVMELDLFFEIARGLIDASDKRGAKDSDYAKGVEDVCILITEIAPASDISDMMYRKLDAVQKLAYRVKHGEADKKQLSDSLLSV